MNIEFQSPVIFVKDIDISRRFYEDLLDQTVDIDFGPNIAFKSGFALWQVDPFQSKRYLILDKCQHLPRQYLLPVRKRTLPLLAGLSPLRTDRCQDIWLLLDWHRPTQRQDKCEPNRAGFWQHKIGPALCNMGPRLWRV